ncbi:hypothetical protein Pmani_027951 [Petrolisthes manimaculis]|uniref:Uncharacterized protein n=1 Tax=Petrolisthes manimaculis TaxID=1843537 RepID=A0AAE1TVA6_9EUCA|nr:hypothetical protein Pmani_027951 [Petrolisthes manimaculis]
MGGNKVPVWGTLKDTTLSDPPPYLIPILTHFQSIYLAKLIPWGSRNGPACSPQVPEASPMSNTRGYSEKSRGEAQVFSSLFFLSPTPPTLHLGYLRHPSYDATFVSYTTLSPSQRYDHVLYLRHPSYDIPYATTTYSTIIIYTTSLPSRRYDHVLYLRQPPYYATHLTLRPRAPPSLGTRRRHLLNTATSYSTLNTAASYFTLFTRPMMLPTLRIDHVLHLRQPCGEAKYIVPPFFPTLPSTTLIALPTFHVCAALDLFALPYPTYQGRYLPRRVSLHALQSPVFYVFDAIPLALTQQPDYNSLKDAIIASNDMFEQEYLGILKDVQLDGHHEPGNEDH